MKLLNTLSHDIYEQSVQEKPVNQQFSHAFLTLVLVALVNLIGELTTFNC